jgi:DNA-binding IclR family transcriptional regulator
MRATNSLVKRCLRVVELMAEDAGAMRLGEIASKLKLAKSGCHRLLTLMEEAGWIEQDIDTGFYRLTLKLAIVGEIFFIGTNIPDICQPVLDRLATQTQALARLALVERDGMAWVSQSQGARTGLMYQPAPAARVRVHATAAGRCWLASLPEEEVVRIVMRTGFGRPNELGPSAISTMDSLLAELKLVRERGWALNDQEVERGVRAVAAPVVKKDGSVVAAVALAGPSLHLSDDRISELTQLTTTAAKDISALWPLRALRSASREDRASPDKVLP